MATLYIIRGIPGSGKSTLAKKLVNPSRHREADMFHMVAGEYLFNPEKVKSSHAWCLAEMSRLIITGNEDCAVSNTFTRKWEYQPYIDVAEAAGYSVAVIDCHGSWDNCHNVPAEVVTSMKERWQPHNSNDQARTVRRPPVDRGRLHDELTQIVARKFHFLAEYMEEKTPLDEIDPEGWRDKYIGKPFEHLLPRTIVFNKFRPEVDCFVAAITNLIEQDRARDCRND